MAAVDLTRWFLGLFFLFVACFYTVRITLLKRRRHASPVFVGHPGSLHWATHTAFRVFRGLILVVCVARLAWPALDRYLLPFNSIWQPAVLMIGNGLLVAGFSTIILIHFYMGEDWRSGTRENDQTRLITKGPFSISRNPMMVCVLVAQLGLFFALPSLFTLVCLTVGTWAVVAQVSVEEQLLRQRFGSEYENYAARTPRWLVFHG